MPILHKNKENSTGEDKVNNHKNHTGELVNLGNIKKTHV